MPTKTIVIGDPCSNGPKKVETLEYIDTIGGNGPSGFNISYCGTRPPERFKYLELICRNYANSRSTPGFDLMFGYNDPKTRSEGVLLVGHWNDGIV